MFEMVKKMIAVSSGEQTKLLSYIYNQDCRPYSNCRNNIRNQKTVQQALDVVANFRQHMWQSSLTNSSGRDSRNLMLIDEHFRIQCSFDNKKFNFTIGYDHV